MQIYKKQKIGNRRIITLFNFIKIKYTVSKRGREYGFAGDYPTWQAAAAQCDGYATDNILQATLRSTLKVKNGEAVFERDSCIFDKVHYSFPLLAGLFKVAAENNNRLRVLDFGGALGSHYFQNREMLKPMIIEKWTVVEQPHYVEVGNEKIADGVLTFAKTIDEVNRANVIILSCVVQYLSQPYQWLEKLIAKGVDYIIIDRTAFNSENRDRLTVQTVPPEIYAAKYPAWFLDEKKFLSYFAERYNLITDFVDHIDIINEIPSKYKGYLFSRLCKSDFKR